MLEKAAAGGTFVLNSEVSPDRVWDSLPKIFQQHITEKKLKFYVIGAYHVTADAGIGKRINTIMQACFFAISGVLSQEHAISAIKKAVEKTYGRKSRLKCGISMPAQAPEFVKRVTGEIIAGWGDLISVSQLPDDGIWPLGSAAFEKRNLALEILVWETDICTHCGKCVFVWTTCSPRAATSISRCSIRRCIPIPVARPPGPPRVGRWPNSPPVAKPLARRTWCAWP